MRGSFLPVFVCAIALVGCKSRTDEFAVEKDPAPSASVETTFTFSAKHAAVGNKQRVSEKSNIAVQMTAHGTKVSLTDETTSEKTAEAIAVNGELYEGAPRLFEVRAQDVRQRQTATERS